MAKHVIFFHGGASKEDYHADAKLVTSLKLKLGAGYSVHYPFLPQKETRDLGRREQISREISASEEGVILVGHSMGASMLLASLSETEISKSIAGIFLTATPFWEGEEDWVEPFKLRPDFAEKLDQKSLCFFTTVSMMMKYRFLIFTNISNTSRGRPFAKFKPADINLAMT